MPFTGLLGHACTIQRLVSTTNEDRFGQPATEWNEGAEGSGIPCRLRRASGKEITDFSARDNLEVTHVLYVDPDVVIVEADRVSEVLDAGGNKLLSNADVVLVRQVSGLEGAQHHLEIALRALKVDG